MLIRCRVPAEEGLFSFLMVVLLCLRQQDWEHHPFVCCECTAPKSLDNLFVAVKQFLLSIFLLIGVTSHLCADFR